MRNKLIAALLAITSVAFSQGISGGGSGGGGGSVTGVTATAPLTSSGGTAPVIAAIYQGNGAKVQASTGTATSGHAVKFDSNGNTIDAGAAPVTQDASGNISIAGGITTGAASGLNGVDYLAGSTSGGAGWSVANVAGTAIVYVMPTTAGTAGQLLEDTGTITCPTNIPAAITAITTLCHQTAWETVSGGGGGFTTQNVVTGSRAFNTTYHNTLTVPLLVTVSSQFAAASNSGLSVFTDAATTPTTQVALVYIDINSPSSAFPVTFVVLPGNYYRVFVNGTTPLPTLEFWIEWN